MAGIQRCSGGGVVGVEVDVFCSRYSVRWDVRDRQKRRRKGTWLDPGLKDRLAVMGEERNSK